MLCPIFPVIYFPPVTIFASGLYAFVSFADADGPPRAIVGLNRRVLRHPDGWSRPLNFTWPGDHKAAGQMPASAFASEGSLPRLPQSPDNYESEDFDKYLPASAKVDQAETQWSGTAGDYGGYYEPPSRARQCFHKLQNGFMIGATLGGAYLYKRLAPRLPGLPLQWLRGYGQATGVRWQEFLEQLARQIDSPEAIGLAQDAAQATFLSFRRWVLDEA